MRRKNKRRSIEASTIQNAKCMNEQSPMWMKRCGCHNLVSASKSNCWACNGQWKYIQRDTAEIHQCCPFARNHLFGMAVAHQIWWVKHTTFTQTHTHTHTNPKHECYLSTKQTNGQMNGHKNKFPFGSFHLDCYQNTFDKLYRSLRVRAHIHTDLCVLHQHRNQSVKMKLI